MQGLTEPGPGLGVVCTPNKLIQFRHGAPNFGTCFTTFGASTHVLGYHLACDTTNAARTK
ncbi:hypothetical protein GCM10010510_07920 [Streptomyces anandii JCM 4720]|nr:hypothetical protein GCM10010510_07920 [Streptomyces anandii JCM 4720]